MLALPGAWIRDVAFSEQGTVVTVALRRKTPACSSCGARGLKIKDYRTTRWRHLDVGGMRCVIECKLRRLYCPGCGDRPEMVEWARGGARHTAQCSGPCQEPQSSPLILASQAVAKWRS
jgi:transposase